MLNHYQGNIHETICNEQIMLKSNYYSPVKAFRLTSHHENPKNYTREEVKQIPSRQRENLILLKITMLRLQAFKLQIWTK